ncbi:MAG: FAD-binding oxidoreductase, partial [Bacteroidetes bacterium]
FDDEKLSCEYRKDGIFWVFREEAGFHHFKKENDLLEPYGLAAKPFVGEALSQAEPALKTDLFGAWKFEVDAWVRPDEVVAQLRQVLKNKGVAFIEDTEIKGFDIAAGKITAAHSDNRKFEARQYVLAMGAWTPLLTRQLGLKVPVVPGKGYSVTMAPPEPMLQHACIFQETKVAATPWKGAFRLGSLMEFAGYDETFSRVRLNALKKGAENYLTTPYSDQTMEEWFGFRPMSVDGLPVIGISSKHKNLIVACGHSMVGLSMATGTGKLVAELATGQPPHVDPTFYGLERFG